MANVDTIARAQLAETRNQLHQVSTALHKGIGAVDAALKSIERVYAALENKGVLDSELIAAETSALRQARGDFASMGLYLPR
ncbi:MAG: hypothetical protein AAGD86_06485 [Pseudomonadota bacterium]